LLRAPEAPSEQLKPEYLASLSINPATALRLLDDFVSLQKGDVIIQNAANSMVGTSVIQIANARGIKTINIIRNRPDHEQMVEKLKSYGAYIVCTEDYVNTPEFRRLVSDLPKPKLALNGTGGPIATEMARLLGENGTFVTYGAMARQPLTFPSSVFLFKNIQVKGFWLSKWLATHSRAERDKMYADLVGLVKANKLRLWVERHNLSNFAEALARSQQPYRERKVMLVLDK
jgi:trans-2-enoyl-CoA reductase